MQNGESSQETLKEDNEILLPKNTVRAFGRALDTIFSQHEEKIKEEMSSMKTDPLVDKARVGFISAGIERINKIIAKMQKSKDVKIVKDKNEFEFSQESEEQTAPRNEEITLSPELTYQMRSAMTHTFYNPLWVINGFLDIIKVRSEAGEAGIRSLSTLLEIFNGITNTLQGIDKADQWKLLTDQHGKTTIVALPKPAESQ